MVNGCVVCCVCFFQAEDGIRDLVRSRGLGDVYKRQDHGGGHSLFHVFNAHPELDFFAGLLPHRPPLLGLSLIHI